jgi:ribonuclease G
MSKEIYISSTPHETRLAVVENDQLAEIYYERENEYTLAGSIYNGKVTRVLPGMQSSFVDIGLERDAFLYVTDFMEEEAVDTAEFDTSPAVAGAPRPERSGERSGGERGRGDRGRGRGRDDRRPSGDAVREDGAAISTGDSEGAAENLGEGAPGADGSRRWRGRRGRRRGRSGGTDQPQTTPVIPEVVIEGGYDDDVPAVEHEFEAAPPVVAPAEQPRREESGRGRREGRGDRGGRDRGGRGGREERGPREDRPSRDAEYGTEEFIAKPAEPLLLPGESLARYRHDDTAGKADIQAAATTQAAKPSNIVEAPLKGWDGGAVLPGESRSVRPDAGRSQGRSEGRSEVRSEQRGDEGRGGDRAGGRSERGGRGGRDRGRGGRGERERRPEIVAVAPLTPESFTQRESLNKPESSQPESFNEEMFDSEVGTEIAADVAQAHEAVSELATPVQQTEYEPEEASASYRVDPGAPSEYRQTVETPVVEDETAFEEEIVEVEIEAPVAAAEPMELPEAQGVHEFTELQPGGEMMDQGTLHNQAVDAVAAAHSVPLTELVGETAPAVESAEVHNPLEFAPGTGELEEEIMEEDEFDGGHFSIQAEEGELDDIEEETVDGAEALGSILRDMSIDEMTGAGPEEDEDEFEESFAGGTETDLEEESFAAEEDGEFAVDEESVSEDGVVADGAAPQPERRGRRDGRRGERDRSGDRDRGSSDRDRGGDRGRRDGRRGRSGGPGRGGRSHAPSMPIPIISDLLKPGQEILVQIAKEPIAKKGARITSHIALPGRFLVFMPTVNHIGVSRKISSDEERRRLKHVLLSEKGEASGGFIVRTAADGASEEELRADLRFLINLWAGIKERSESSKSPALIYHDLNLVERILRDQVTDNFSAIWVDSETEYERVLRFLQRFQPSLIRRVKLYSKEVPLFEQFGITEEINKALRSKVWLKSGGSIVINQTEALVAIDINTGKYVGKTARLEDTILKTNLDAIPEIVRQIRLRDLGGIIVIDFIDMDERKNRNKVLQALEDELKSDRAPSKVLPFNDFGLIAITRKRVKQSLERTLSTTCNICQGTGMVKSPVTVCNDIFIEMRKMHRHLERGDIMLRVHPEVVKQLKSNGARWLSEMEEMAGKTILVKSDPALHPEQFDIH